MAEIIAHLTLDTYRKNNVPPLVVPQGDYGARIVCVAITNRGVPVTVNKSSETVSIVAKRSADGESEAFSGEVNDDGTVNVPVTQWMLEYAEEVTCHVVITGTDYQYSTTSFLLDPQEKSNPTEISEDDPNRDLISEVLSGEQARIAAETARVAAETERQDAEEERQVAESERITNEATRIENESARIEAEQQRETKFNGWGTAIGSLDSFDARITRNEKRLTNLEQGIPDDEFLTDSSVAYAKDVPENALPYAKVSKIGGMTRKCANLITYPYVLTSKTEAEVTITVNENGSVTVNGTPTYSLYIKLSSVTYLAGKTYTLSGCPSGGSNNTYVLYDDTLKQYDTGSGVTFTVDEDTTGVIYIKLTQGITLSNVVFYPMLNKGSISLPYTLYTKKTFPIPEAVQALDGYGLGLDETYYNSIEWDENGGVIFNKQLAFLDLTSLNWNKMGSYETWEANIEGYNIRQAIGNYGVFSCLHSLYIGSSISNTVWNSIENTIAANGNKLYCCNKQTTTPSGLLLYVMDSTESTDISDILTADNYIGVEGNGTISMVNEYLYDVPSEITYQLEQEVS